MKTSTLTRSVLGAALAAALVSAAGSAGAHRVWRPAVAGPADVRVWVDGGDVFPGYGDVTIRVRSDRDCYSTLFLVDTAGYIHVLYPNDGYEDGWLTGGYDYSYRGYDLGLDRFDGAGIAYVFAVGSPVPFDYAAYGAGVFVGGFGFRIYGDPFLACREFYMSLLPAGCRWDYVGVGFTRFYVRQWVRYPSYLCYGGPAQHVRVGDACRLCADVYTTYRCNMAAPYEAIRPVPRFKERYGDGHERSLTLIRRAPEGMAPRHEKSTHVRPRVPAREGREAIDRGDDGGSAAPRAAKGARQSDRVRVVSTNKSLAAGETVARRKGESVKSAPRVAGRAPSGNDMAMRAERRDRDNGKAGGREKVARTSEKGAKKRARQAE